MRAIAIAESEPAIQRLAALVVASHMDVIEAFLLQCADEALGATVGPRVVRLGWIPSASNAATALRTNVAQSAAPRLARTSR